ncbi:thioredoxin [Laspinema sp. D1]|uniref:Thioredoxin n=1 Tax=Laspinema palackyanum D2a TaxID=2953684 RepID=A0ABT2MWK8_9CYAN|nr:thioredoxin [Laspinema sp. D2b]MCT7969148.1 thioredoxin [Laspinema sp. D2a]
MSSIIKVTDTEFGTEVEQAATPVLAYFWASWCGPCRLVSPYIDWAASEYGDRLKVLKLEVDPNPESVKKCGVEGVPAIRVFKDGAIVESFEGAITKQALATLIEAHL